MGAFANYDVENVEHYLSSKIGQLHFGRLYSLLWININNVRLIFNLISSRKPNQSRHFRKNPQYTGDGSTISSLIDHFHDDVNYFEILIGISLSSISC